MFSHVFCSFPKTLIIYQLEKVSLKVIFSLYF